MRSSWIALVCVVAAACGGDSNGSVDGGVLPGPTLQLGEVCTDSRFCASSLCLAVSDTRAVCSQPCSSRGQCPAGESWDCVVPTGEQTALCACTSNSVTEICGDGRDNDCDGVTDCATDGMDGGTMPIPDSGTEDSGQQADASTCPNNDCEPAPTCESDPGLCPLCVEDIDCEDGAFCTQDICRAGGCVHIPRDNGCDADQICDPRSKVGCVDARPCASDDDCTDNDACTISEYCDTTNAICRMGFLDADRDEHMPTGCGGDDCNDDDPRSYPGALDICDNRDNDCDGMIDPPSAALLCAEGRMCQVGVCICAIGLEQCGAGCVDPASYQTDARNCGACGNNCGAGRQCVEAMCEDIDECEDDDRCPAHSTCMNYIPGYDCVCDDGYEEVGGQCIDANECLDGLDDCDSYPNACVNIVEGFECECPDGWTGSGVGDDGCEDIDECEDPTACPGSNTECLNEDGTYSCGCDDGYIPDAGGACGNYNECARGEAECDTNPGICTDEVGGYECTCPSTHAKVDEGYGDLGCASRVTALPSGGQGYHQCAILTGGRVMCWGSNFNGQLAIGSAYSVGSTETDMIDESWLSSLGTGRTAKAMTIGSSHTCAILDNDSVKCWGYNGTGQLGIGSTVNNWGDGLGEIGNNLPVVNLGTGRTAKAIAAGEIHTCAILDDNTVKCWGGNNAGQLGRDNLTNRGRAAADMGDNLAAINLGAGRTAKAITAGSVHTCAILDDDTVKCWGGNTSGQLGDGTTTNKGDGAGEMAAIAPVDLGAGVTAKAISAGLFHTCAILNNDSVKCWGAGNRGALGNDSTGNRGDAAGEMGAMLPTAILGAGRTAQKIAAGAAFTCAILDNNALKCWGSNDSGELGLGTTGDVGTVAGSMATLTGLALGTGVTPVTLRAGHSHVCALLNDERVKCWGSNGTSELGQGDQINRGDNAGEMGDSLPYTRLGG